MLTGFPVVRGIGMRATRKGGNMCGFQLHLSPFLERGSCLVRRIEDFFCVRHGLYRGVKRMDVISAGSLTFATRVRVLPRTSTARVLTGIFCATVGCLTNSIHVGSVGSRTARSFVTRR